jgi:phosphatidylinositol alpha-1,6-mannosyltransferase
MNPQSILLLSEIFPPATGGSGRWMWEIYTRQPTGQLIIVAGEHRDAGSFDQTHDLPIHRLPLRFDDWGILSLDGWGDYRRTAGALDRITTDKQISQVHCGRILPEGWLGVRLARKHKARLVVYIHGEELNSIAGSRQLRWMARRVFNRADTVIANSHNTADILRGRWGIDEPRLTVMHPGVDTQRFCPCNRDPELRAGFGWADRPVILTVSRLQQRKGHDQMIRALPRVIRQVPDVLYAIVGQGEQQQSLQNLVHELNLHDHVQLLGGLIDSDMIHACQQCDLFVLPNRTVDGDIEGFGMVLLEAQACGKPVIAGRSGGTAETMQADRTGVIIDCNDPEALAGAATALLTDRPRARAMGQAGRRWTVEQFDWAVCAARAAEVFGRTIPLRHAA